MTESAAPASPRASAIPWPVWAVLSGVLLGLAQPIVIESITGKVPLDGTGLTGLLGLFALTPALIAIRDAGPKRAYAVGFVTFFVAFSIIINWIVTTVHVYGGSPLYAALPVLFLLVGAMAAYVAAAFAVSRVVVRFFGWPLWLVFPPVLAATELLRNVGPVGGFPWGSVGHSFATVPVFLQLASVVGVTGLNFLAALVAGALAQAHVAFWQEKRLDKVALGVAVVVVAGWAGFGVVRLGDDITSGPSVKVALLQPNVNEGLADLTHEPKAAILERFHRLEKTALDQGAEMVLWPEGSFPNRGLSRDLKDFQRVPLVPEGTKPPVVSVVGASVSGRIPDPDGGVDKGGKPKQKAIRQNSAFIVDGDLNVKGRFDKSHLVPFGEYVPWPFGAIVRQFIPLGTTHPGNALLPTAVTANGKDLSVGVTICYEGVFPEVSRAIANNGATIMANLTDDRWYGVSGMATQHLLMYALRAVETGRPVARATNTGRSAFIDIHGGIHDATGLYEEAVLVRDVPLQTRNTLYLALGDWLAFLSLLFTLGAWFVAMLGGRDFITRKKSSLALALGVIGGVSLSVGLVLWLRSDGLDEALSTRAMLLGVSGLLVGLGALSQKSWGRRAVMVVGVLAIVFGGVAVVVAGADKLLVVGVGVMLVILGRRLVVTRPAPPTSGS
jgi:apolipoprotein N-acyltransferase